MRVVVLIAGVWWAASGAVHAQDSVLSGPADATGGQPPAAAPPSGDAAAPADQPVAPKPEPTPEPAAPRWQAHQTASIQVLDKVDGQSSTLAIGVGGTGSYRALTISVLSCYARPPDQAADATALLVITDAGQTTPRYAGWMLAGEPAAAMMQHPVYDVRVLGCR